MVNVPDRETLGWLLFSKALRMAQSYTMTVEKSKKHKLEEADFEHYKINHCLNFIDPYTDVYTLTVERLLGSANW